MNRDGLIKFISTGGELAGAAIGGAIGLLGGPVGAIGGGVAGVTVAKGISEVAQRVLSDREHVRIAASSTFILSSLKDRLDQGYQVREDGFFTSDQSNRSPAEELFEGVLLKCRDSFEEKKIKYLSKIFEETTFNDEITPETANQILSIAQSMSYRKFCILSFAYKNQNGQLTSLHLDTTSYRDCPSDFGIERYLLFQDFYELQNFGLLTRSDDTSILEAADVTPALMHTTDIGRVWVEIMGLDAISLPEMSFLRLISQN